MNIKYRGLIPTKGLLCNIELSDQEYYVKDIDKMKCFLYWENNKVKDTKNFKLVLNYAYIRNDFTKVELRYKSKADAKLHIKFFMSFSGNGKFTFDEVFVKHETETIKYTQPTQEFLAEMAFEIQDIVNNLLRRDYTNDLCKSCIYWYKYRMSSSCKKLYTKNESKKI